jgi:6-phosphogluconolactonase (cycloisomerase 2 family)
MGPVSGTRFFLGVSLVLILLLSLISCGGGNSSTSPSGTPQPGSPPPPATGNRFLYVGVSANNGGLQGFHVDPTTGALAEVPGSPLLFGGPQANSFSQAGPVAVAQGHIFVGFGPPNFAPPVIRSYAVNPTTGALGNFTETPAGAVNGDNQFRFLATDPAGRNLYAVYQNGIASFQVNSDGSLNYLGTLGNLATATVFSLAISPTANVALLGVDNCPPKGPCGGPPNMLLLNRDPSNGALTNSSKMLWQNSTSSPGFFVFDPSGKFLIVWRSANSGGNSDISVFSFDPSTDVLTQVGSPNPPPGGLGADTFRFDSTGKFLYTLDASAASPNPMSVGAFAFDPGSGALTPVGVQSLPSGNFPSTVVVDDSFVVAVTSQAGTMPSVIYVLHRDASTGNLSAPVFSLTDRPAGLQAGLGDAVELRF